MISLARQRHPTAAIGAQGPQALLAALARDVGVLDAQPGWPDHRGHVDLILPDPPTLVVLHGGKRDADWGFNASRQLGLCLAADVDVQRVLIGVFVHADDPSPRIVERWGATDLAHAALIDAGVVYPHPPRARARGGERVASHASCEHCDLRAACADDLPGWHLAQLAFATAEERAYWKAHGLTDPADVLRLAPPAHAWARRALAASASGQPSVHPQAAKALAEIPSDAAALDIEGWDQPLAPWPHREAFPRQLTQLAVATGTGAAIHARSWMAMLDGDAVDDPDAEAADTLLRWLPGSGPILVWGHDDAHRVRQLAARVRRPEVVRLADRFLDVSKRVSGIVWPHQLRTDLKSTARAAARHLGQPDPWAALPSDFHLTTARALGRLDQLATYNAADARAVLVILDAARAVVAPSAPG